MSILRSLPALFLFVLVLSATAQRPTGSLPEKVVDQLRVDGFHASDLADLIVKDDYRSAHNGITHTFFRQRWQGIEVWNGDIAVHAAANGEVIKVNIGAFTAIEKRINSTQPVLTAESALAAVLARTAPGKVAPALVSSNASEHSYTYDGTEFGHEPVIVKLVYQPVDDRLLLAWNVNHYTTDGMHWWSVRVDALTGAELDRNDWVAQCAWDDHGHAVEECPSVPMAPAAPNDYRVFPAPVESPSHGSRAIRNAPWTMGGIASPYGWHDTNGASGAEYTDTRGNNCYAQEDADNNNSGGARPSGGATLDFDFPLDLTQAPATYLDAATTNLFYWNNIVHDVWYQYGFDDPAGNFQQNNYGRGGAGNDYVNADAQDGSGTNNANFGTPPDGSSPRMQMYRWTYTTPNRDSDLDNGVIAHEYGHGISNRLVGGPANTNCLGNVEQMGEGWSDYFGLMMTMEPGDQGTDGRGIGTYVMGQPVTGPGIRPSPYSTNFSVNSYTYAATNSGSIAAPHGIGFVWCTMLWEMTWELIGVHGFDPDLYNGTGGNNIAMQLVIDGLKLTPCSPGFVDGRDAILLADQQTNGGANQNAIWAAFARRGLGASASQGSSNNRYDQTETFDTPLPLNIGVSAVQSPQGAMWDCAATNAPVTVTIRNYGQQAQSNFEVRYQLDGGSVITGTYTGSLASGASASYTFSQPVTITGNGAHTLVASTNLIGDQYVGNDASSSAITVSTPTTVAATYSQNIEATSPTPAGWSLQNPDAGNTWVTVAVSGQSACVGTRAWGIDNYSVSTPGQEDRLVTPVVDLTGSAGSRLKFQHAYSGYSSSYVDGMRVEVSGDCGSTWTTLYEASGSALQSTGYVTSAWSPSSCSQWLAHDLDISAYDGSPVIFRFVAINDYGNWLYLDDVVVERNGVRVALKLMLEGPYDIATDRMRDDLRAAGQVPLTEPYTVIGFPQVSGGGGETINAAVLTTTGDNAIVDWVHVQLRSSATPGTILATRCALVQRDGDVVDKDGVSPVSFQAGNGNYYVAVKHRNHLGAMTAAAVALTSTATGVDLSSPGTAVYGTEARKSLNGRALLWAGNVLPDAVVRYIGLNNDRDPILQAIGGSIPTAESTVGYHREDVNMDGIIRYIGTNNDRDPILLNVGGSIPTNTRPEQLP
ncbi:MAG: M36 family metallopeptidase [Flavobacteriales bacterium]|nr:M36 family metallopeptidase [Flavobacteriales bacterium]